MKRGILGILTAIALFVAVPSVLARGISTLRASNPNARVNLRARPTINANTSGYGLAGDKVKVIECVPDKDKPNSDLNWCEVEFVGSKAVGWIRSDFIIFADGGE